ncbi:motility associated factor glycosyltransferase family protein [Psychrobacillus sp. L3]|uniref:motility associated factor glycosyltransferase family protein n=1 Tax=Psychrobacillus sp. L3 TaxID=3236891 RepID=UPI0036F19EFE
MNNELEIEKIETKRHNYTLKVNGYFLHSKYDPEKEAEQFIEKNYKPNHTTILFGCGMGYYAKALLNKKNKEEKLIIIEPLIVPDENIDKQIEAFIIQATSQDVIKSLFMNELDMYSNLHIICSPNYNHLFPELYVDILSIIKDRVSVNKIVENTVRRYANDWQENYLHNLGNAFMDQSLENLFQKHTCPVVIASGGPSLTKQIEQLKKVKDKIILIAAGSTINTLLKNDINPDYVVSIDGGKANYHHFKQLTFQKTKLIYSMYNHFLIRESFNNPSYYFLSSDAAHLSGHMEKVLNTQFPIIIGGGSVANYALSIAMYISSGPVTLIGQDLAYTDNKSHAEHNRSFSIIDEAYMKKRGIFLTKGYYGEDVPTDYAFYTMKEHFEEMVKSIGEQRLIHNSTEGGIFLEGFKQVPFVEFCEEYVDYQYKKNINAVNPVAQSETSYETFILQMKHEDEIYNKINLVLIDSLSTIKQNKNNSTFSPSVLKRLDKNDKKIENLFEQVPMSSILTPITMDVMKKFSPKANETEKEKYERVFEQNKTLYERLLEVTYTSQQYTSNLIEQIKEKSELSK